MSATVVLLDEGTAAGHARWHYHATIDGDEWKAGDVFYVRDHRGAPRKQTFRYICFGPSGSWLVAFNHQYYRGHAAGFYTLVDGPPPRAAISLTDIEIEVQATAADLLDAGLDHDANQLLELLDVGDDDEVHAALDAARKKLDELETDE
jgi:hypothetical protein